MTPVAIDPKNTFDPKQTQFVAWNDGVDPKITIGPKDPAVDPKADIVTWYDGADPKTLL